MDYFEWQLQLLQAHAGEVACVWRDKNYTFGDLYRRTTAWMQHLLDFDVLSGSVVAVRGDFSPDAIACILALAMRRCIILPLAKESELSHSDYCRISQAEFRIDISAFEDCNISSLGARANHALIEQLRSEKRAGLVLFSSGSSGIPKAIVHSLARLLDKFRQPRKKFRTIMFLLFDHIGGINTLFYTLANLGCAISPEDHSVQKVCSAIQEHKAELLPTSPSFLNLLLLSKAYEDFDLSSLQLITYGTEVMPQRTLAMLNKILPLTSLQQTYGLSEMGILRCKSASNESLQIKIGGEHYETRCENGTLRIRSKCSMLGYLNAPDPFDKEGWFDTGDIVIQEGEYYRLLGRQSEVINVGGQKLYPAEVEEVIAELSEVNDVLVSAEAHLILGETVVATVQSQRTIPDSEMKRRVVEHCRGRLQPHMIPSKVRVVKEPLMTPRFKKIRP